MELVFYASLFPINITYLITYSCCHSCYCCMMFLWVIIPNFYLFPCCYTFGFDMGWIVFTITHMLKSWPPAPWNVTGFGDRTFNAVIMLKSGPSDRPAHIRTGVLLREGTWAHKKAAGMWWTAGRPAEDAARRQPSASQEERGLRRNQTCPHLELRLLTSKTVRK